MNFLQTFRLAWIALMRNKMRSLLTMLGVIIGVGAVIAMVAIGEGAQAAVEAQFDAMGTNLLIVMPGSVSTGGVAGGYGSSSTLTWDDLKSIQNEISGVKAAAPYLRSNAQIIAEDANWSTQIQGTSPDLFIIRNWPADKGALFTQQDIDAANKVVVLGATASGKLFGDNVDATGLQVRIKGIPFTVLGVAAKKGQSPQGQDYDDTAFVPYTAYARYIGKGLDKYISGQIYIAAMTANDVPKVQADVSALLRDRHATLAGADDDFSIRNLAEIANSQEQSQQTLAFLLASVAAVSLVVGGIGIMNIMLVSVTERTREIGVRMAIGARPIDILSQFLVEAIAISVTGGMIGVMLGVLSAQGIAVFAGWAVVFRADVVFLSVGFSALVGVGFGIYPAQKASQLDPITALRFE
jgi:putative ABC transport system permease protein